MEEKKATSNLLLEVRGLSKSFASKHFPNTLRAVDNVDLQIHPGESIGLVGESGSGKTTLGRLLLGLSEPTSGTILFDGNRFTAEDKRWLKEFRRRTSIVFQDPYSSLDPHMLVIDIIAEPMDVQGNVSKNEREQRVARVLKKLGLDEALMFRYPHEFSGGQRQRIAIARAIVNEPDFVVLDEPTSALDVSVQAQVLNLLNDIRTERPVAFLLISHDLGLVRYVTQRTAVMYLGRIIEVARTEDIFQSPLHPYTQALLSSIPESDPKAGLPTTLAKGEIPSPLNVPAGCRFHPRCLHAMDKCRAVEPQLIEVSGGHYVSCYLHHD